jgi:hypothetical protein
MLRLKSRYLVDGAAIGSAEFLRRVTGKAGGRLKTASLQDSRHKRERAEATSIGNPSDTSVVTEVDLDRTNPEFPNGKSGVAMRFGQWGGLRVLRDLRVNVVG